MPPRQGPKRLIVEGYDDLQSVIGLMRAHVPWPNNPNDDPPVYIERGGSPKEILHEDYLPLLLKSRDVTTLGVMLDADEASHGRYQRARTLCSPQFPSMPGTLPPEGLVVSNHDGKRFGFWVMPDNSSPGYLETFLRYLVPDQQDPTWRLAVESVTQARAIGATCKQTHVPKANLYTWLAWQDEPGQIAGRALRERILDPNSPHAAAFVSWFRALYEV